MVMNQFVKVNGKMFKNYSDILLSTINKKENM